MMNAPNFSRLISVTLSVLVASCTFVTVNTNPAQTLLTGTGSVTDSTINLSGFTNLKLTGIPAVQLVQGSAFSVRVSAYQNLLPVVTATKQGNTLTVGTQENVSVTNNNIVFTIQLPVLEGVESRGTGSVEAKTDFSCNALTTVLAGTGNVTLTGKARSISISLRGTGSARLVQFPAETVSIDLAGTGNAEVFAEKTLTGTLNGTGRIRYKGSPAVSVRVNGTGTVSPF